MNCKQFIKKISAASLGLGIGPATTNVQTQESLPFQDKVVLVTGAARGIGKATAMAFARLGAKRYWWTSLMRTRWKTSKLPKGKFSLM